MKLPLSLRRLVLFGLLPGLLLALGFIASARLFS